MARLPAYRPDIDGLRAFAVTAVILFHYEVWPFSGGFVGVDVFFVISGFLITGIIAPEIAEARFSLVGFYERRLRRILPALLVVLLACAVASLFVFLPNDMRLLGASLTQSALFTSNIFFYSVAQDYFAADTLTLQPLLHTWSLSVEAQFYLVYPAILLAGRRWSVAPMRLLGLLAVLSFAAGAWGAIVAPTPSFYLLPTRAWELLLGGIVALGGIKPPRSLTDGGVLTALGLALIGFGIFAYGRTTPFPGVAALPPCLGAACVILAGAAPGAATSWIGRLLRAPPMVFIGRISYSLYLWHWPLLVLTRYGRATEPPPMLRLALLALTLLLSVASWWLIERPFVIRRRLPARRALLAGAACGMAFATACGECLDLAGRGLLPIAQLPQDVLTLANGQFDRIEGECWPGRAPPGGGLPCRFGASVAPGLLVWGNSYARMWTPALDVAARRHGMAGLAVVRSKCPPLVGISFPGLPDCAAFNRATLDFVLAHAELRTVVLGADWFTWTEALPALQQTIAAVSAEGRTVVILLAPPQADYSVPRMLALAALRHEPAPAPIIEAAARAAQRRSNDIIATLAGPSGAMVIDPATVLCDGSTCAVERDGHPLFYDAGHVTRTAALSSAALFEPLFTAPAR